MWSVIPSGDVVLADLTKLEDSEFGPFVDEAVQVVQRDRPQELLILVLRGKPETARLAPVLDEARERIEGRGVPVRLVYVDDEPKPPEGVEDVVRQITDDAVEQDRATDNGMPEKAESYSVSKQRVD
jgi:hypothetical protein